MAATPQKAVCHLFVERGYTMTKAKQQVIDMLRDIPDDKVVHILEMMRPAK